MSVVVWKTERVNANDWLTGIHNGYDAQDAQCRPTDNRIRHLRKALDQRLIFYKSCLTSDRLCMYVYYIFFALLIHHASELNRPTECLWSRCG